MPKGKTNAPLTIDVWLDWHTHPAVALLRANGHTLRVYGTPTTANPDWIMHPAAGWSEVFFAKDDKGNYPFVQARLRAERARKRAGK